ncbi:MAG: helix-turn-helix domain-containing protein [Coriobacteriales bacterium]|jgi:transcriptional regulator with XRE-family HTH domain|nr:helix-turn-helix domain-containing protein [Coriobacteriales bacterium]
MLYTQEDIITQRKVISHRLRIARESSGLTQKAMGQQLNMTPQGYARYEKGSDISSTLLLKCCAILGCSSSWLLGTTDEVRPTLFKNEELAELSEKFNSLNKKSQKCLIEYAELLASHPRFSNTLEPNL